MSRSTFWGATLLSIFFSYSAEAADLGVNVHLPANTFDEPAELLNRAAEMKINWGRMDFRWDFVEPEPMDDVAAQGHWDIMDASIYQMKRRGINVLAIIQAPGGWATTNGKDNGVLNATGVEHYARFVKAVAERYKNYVTYYEIFNEPNLKGFYEGTVDTYVDQLLIPAREILKAVDANTKVTGPALSNLLSSDIKVQDFYKRLGQRQTEYKNRTGQKFFDIITHHTYNANAQGVAEEFTKGRKTCVWFLCYKQRDPINDIFKNNGFADEPVWLTEVGWEASRDEADQERQANLIIETLSRLAQVPRMENVFIYHLQDDPSAPTDYGLLFSDSSPKKVYYRLRDR